MKTFRGLLAMDRKFMGTILQFPCPEIVEMMKEAGSDYIIIDNEHSYATYEQTVQMLRAAQAVDLPAMVRIPEITEDAIKKVIDMGFTAIRVPTVQTEEDAKSIVRYAKFAPEGDRGACPFVRANGFGGRDQISYYKESNEQLVIAVNIEGPEGVKNMEKIIAVPGIDIVNVGRVDLSVACGVPGQTTHPLVEDAIRRVSELCVKYGKCSGTYIKAAEEAKKYRDYPGITHFLTITPETVLIQGFRELYGKICENM